MARMLFLLIIAIGMAMGMLGGFWTLAYPSHHVLGPLGTALAVLGLMTMFVGSAAGLFYDLDNADELR